MAQPIEPLESYTDALIDFTLALDKNIPTDQVPQRISIGDSIYYLDDVEDNVDYTVTYAIYYKE